MFKNYLKVTFRNLLRQRIYSLINITGLAIGMACSIFIFAFVINELSYDKFHKKADRIYRLCLIGKIQGKELKGAYTCVPAGKTMQDEFPEIAQFVRLQGNGDMLIKYEDKAFVEQKIIYADSTFFDVFSLPLVQGNPATALAAPNTVVITKKIAEKYFGSDNPLDKMLTIGGDTIAYKVTGVISKVPITTHLDFDFLLAMSSQPNNRDVHWLSNNLFTYLVLERGVSHEQVEKKIPDLLQKYASRELMEAFGITFEEFEKAGNLYTYKLQPLCDIHLNTEIEGGFKPNNSRMYVYIFSLIAIFILVIACINFMNLSTARSANRAKEVGIRKVMGSLPRQLMFQFLFESLVLSFFSLFIALLLVEILMPVFRNFVNLELELNYFSNPYIIPGLVGIALFVGVLAGSYPAFLLSSFKPIAVLKGKLVKGSKSGNLRTVLVVFQFAISIFILLSTTTIYKQLNYLLNKDLGFDREQLLVLPRGEALKKQIPQFKQELLRNPVVLSATNSTSIPGYPNNHNGYQIEGRDPSEAFLLYTTWIDYDFFNTYRIELKEGRFHDLKFTSDSFAVLINEAAVRKFAITDPLNTRFIQPTDRDTTLFRQVIGVVKDFNFQSLHTPIEPAVFMIKPANWEWGGYLTVRLKKNEITESVDFVESKWKDFSQNQPFDYFFFDDRYTEHYKEEKRTGRISTMFSILAIFIACLGLLGLISFAAEQRTKEIGVRKVLGASGYSIIFLLSKEIFVLLGIAIVLASPVAYLIMNKWLENFAYRIDYNMPVFIILVLGAISVSFLIAMLTVLYQAVYATRRNPIEALRYE